jgi:hypothetical protein
MHVHRVIARVIRPLPSEHCAVFVVFQSHLVVLMKRNTNVPNNKEHVSDNEDRAKHDEKVSINQKPVANRCYFLEIIQVEDKRSNDGVPGTKDDKHKHACQ